MITALSIKKTNKKKIAWKTHYFYNSYWITKFWNKIMFSGKRLLAVKVGYYMFNMLKNKNKNLKSPNFLFLNLITRFKPKLSLARFRKGKLMHQVPIPVHYTRSFKIILKWLKFIIKEQQFNNKRINNIRFKKHYAAVFVNIFSKQNKNLLMKKLSSEIEIIEENKVYVHFRWF